MDPVENGIPSGCGIELCAEALAASGVSTTEAVREYETKLDALVERFLPARGDEDKPSTCRRLFEWLWQEKPSRYMPRGSFRLDRVIDSQLSPTTSAVGNCLGLTVLYNVLAQRLGLTVEAIHLENAFGHGPHVLSLLRAGGRETDVEHVFPHGFGYEGHLGNPGRIMWGDAELVGDIYHSAGREMHEEGRLDEAVGAYTRALILNPNHTTARINRGLALLALGRVDEAAGDMETG